MRYREFVRKLSFGDKLIFTAGLLFERIMFMRARFEKLKSKRSFFTTVTRMGYKVIDGVNKVTLGKDALEIELRENGSDFEVFKQVLVADEYRPVLDYLQLNRVQVNTVIDAGCNIGLTAIRIFENFPSARIFCVEPDPSNFEQMAHNLRNKNAVCLQNALWFRDEELFFDFGFRDGQEWSRRVSNQNDGGTKSVKGISLNSLIKKYQLDTIDLLKIDIEGSEEKVFGEGSDLSFLERTKAIAIEIHDEFNCRRMIYDTFLKRGFAVFNAGELTIAMNLKMLALPQV